MTFPHRRVVPQGYVIAELVLEGTGPLLMNSGEVDRDSETFRTYYNLGQKRGKTLEDEETLRALEWTLALYWEEETGPYIPGKNVKEMLRAAATKWRRGEDIKRSLMVVDYRVPLIYKGPRDVQGLWDDGFRYTAMVANAGVNRGRVVRCRPMFENWSLKVELAYDPEDVDFDTLEMVVERSQKYGLGDYRPEFGSFMASINVKAKNKRPARGDAAKRRNGASERAHDAGVRRVKTAT